MIPAGFAGVEQMLATVMLAAIRPGAAFVAAPLLGGTAVPVQLRFIIAVALGMPGLAQAPTIDAASLISLSGLAIVVGEVVIGAALGGLFQLAYAAALLAGETIGNAMGLGFAVMSDPLTAQQSNAVSQWMGVVATLLFLAADGHLLLAGSLARSYAALPVAGGWPDALIDATLALGGTLFAAGVAIALPVTASILLVQLCFAMLSRTAPQLNLFAVGLPASLMAGIVLFALAMPAIGDALGALIQQSADLALDVAGDAP